MVAPFPRARYREAGGAATAHLPPFSLPLHAFPRETSQTVLWEEVFLPPPYLIRRLPDQFHTVNIILPSFWEKGMTQAPG